MNGAGASVTGLGVWLPEEIRTNDAWPADFGQQRDVSGDRTFNDIPPSRDAAALTAQHLAAEAGDPFLGAIERRVAAAEICCVDVEVAAARDALSDAGIRGQQVDAVISYSMVPDRLMPAAAAVVADAVGARAAMTFSMDAACATVIPQLAAAVALVESGAARNVLLTQSHLLLRAFPMLHPAAPGLGDVATAFVVGREPRWRVLGTHSVTHGEFYPAVTWIRGSDDANDPPWYRPGGEFRLGSRDRAAAKQLMRDTVTFGSQTVAELCAKLGRDLECITTLASVQPRGWIPAAIAAQLGLSPNAAVSTYEKYAHVGACGPVLNWHHARIRGRQQGLLALYAQGAGFTRAAALISLDVSNSSG